MFKVNWLNAILVIVLGSACVIVITDLIELVGGFRSVGLSFLLGILFGALGNLYVFPIIEYRTIDK